MKKSRHILFLCALALAATPALGASTEDSSMVDTAEDVATKDVALEKDSLTDEPATDELALEHRQSRSLAKAALTGAALGVGAMQVVVLALCRSNPDAYRESFIPELETSPWWVVRTSLNYAQNSHWRVVQASLFYGDRYCVIVSGKPFVFCAGLAVFAGVGAGVAALAAAYL